MAVSKVILNGTTLMDVTTDTVTEETLITGYTATKNNGTKINGAATAGGFEVGDILQSVRTDLGTDWALCNGGYYNPTTYSDFASVMSKNNIPKRNPSGQASQHDVTREMYNGEWVSHNGTSLTIFNTEGIKKYTDIAVSTIDSTTNASILGVEHNGTYYVVFTSDNTNNATLRIYTTTDFSSVTLRATLSGNYRLHTNNDCYGAYFDGTYYVVCGQYSPSYPTGGGTYGMVIKGDSATSFTKSYDTAAIYYYESFSVCKSGNTHTIFRFNGGSEGYTYIYYLDKSNNGQFVSIGSQYSESPVGHYDTIISFNDTIYAAIGYYVPVIGFFSKTLSSGMGFLGKGNYSYSSNTKGAWVNSEGTHLLSFYINGTEIYCKKIPLSATSPWSSSTPIETINTGIYYTHFPDYYYGQSRSNDNIILSHSGTDIIRGHLLPTLTSNEAYYYIKVQ